MRVVEETEALNEIDGVVEDLYLIANRLDVAGRSRLAKEAAELAAKAVAFATKLKGELR